jgi:chitin disaccharide deacetylase
VVNADDLGRTAAINSGVFEAHRHGVVTSATLMVIYPAAPAAAREAATCPGLGVGLHVQLSGGAPLLPAEALPSLVDEHGLLPRRPDERLAGADPAEVRSEVRAQLERFRELTGRLPTHLDSHHHAHRLPVVLGALGELAREHRLPVRAASAQVAAELRQAGLVTTDGFVEDFYDEAATPETLRRILEELPRGVTELMCHPGRVDAELRSNSAYVDAREREIEVLTAQDTRRWVQELDIRLVHFGDLAKLRAEA